MGGISTVARILARRDTHFLLNHKLTHRTNDTIRRQALRRICLPIDTAHKRTHTHIMSIYLVSFLWRAPPQDPIFHAHYHRGPSIRLSLANKTTTANVILKSNSFLFSVCSDFSLVSYVGPFGFVLSCWLSREICRADASEKALLMLLRIFCRTLRHHSPFLKA